MKTIIIAFLLAQATSTSIPEMTTTTIPLEQTKTYSKAEVKVFKADLKKICDISKKAKKMSKSRKYRNDLVGIAQYVADRIEKDIKSETIKKLHQTIRASDIEQREDLWHKSADDLGVNNWRCPGIGKSL